MGVGISGVSTAIAKTDLTWVTPAVTTYMTFAAPYAGTYKVSKFGTTNISATYTYSGIPADKTMTASSVTFAIAQTNGTPVASTTTSVINPSTPFSAVYTVKLTDPTVDIVANTTITGGVDTAALGSYGQTPFPQTAGTARTVSTTSNVDVSVVRSDAWILINDTAADVNLPPDTGFTINTTTNNTGASRQGTITITNTNSRISPALSPVQIIITQNG